MAGIVRDQGTYIKIEQGNLFGIILLNTLKLFDTN